MLGRVSNPQLSSIGFNSNNFLSTILEKTMNKMASTSFYVINAASVEDIGKLIAAAPNKQCLLDTAY